MCSATRLAHQWRVPESMARGGHPVLGCAALRRARPLLVQRSALLLPVRPKLGTVEARNGRRLEPPPTPQSPVLPGVSVQSLVAPLAGSPRATPWAQRLRRGLFQYLTRSARSCVWYIFLKKCINGCIKGFFFHWNHMISFLKHLFLPQIC